MRISQKALNEYVSKLSKQGKLASEKMKKWIELHPSESEKELVKKAVSLVNRYGEASAELSCEMYERIARSQNVKIETAEAEEVPDFGEIAKAIYGTLKESKERVPDTVERLVKQVGSDTTLRNAKRDGAYFAWVTNGDSCKFCMVMAALGWQRAGKNTIKGNHAIHIHAHCDCQYIVDFKGNMSIEGYNPEVLRNSIGYMFGRQSFEDIINMYGNDIKEVVKAYEKNIRKSVKQLETEASAWSERLNEMERKYIEKYTYNPGDKKPNRLFERLNRMLRDQDDHDEYLEYIAAEISSGLNKYKLDQGIVCYRRTDSDYFSKYDVGEEFDLEQFTSTSIDAGATIKGDVLTVFYLKKDTPGAYLRKISLYPNQKEFLIDRDVRVKVKSRKENVIELEVV